MHSIILKTRFLFLFIFITFLLLSSLISLIFILPYIQPLNFKKFLIISHVNLPIRSYDILIFGLNDMQIISSVQIFSPALPLLSAKIYLDGVIGKKCFQKLFSINFSYQCEILNMLTQDHGSFRLIDLGRVPFLVRMFV